MRRGPLLMVVAAFFFTVMTAAAKVARDELSAVEVVAWRAIIAIPICLLLAGRTRLDVGNRRAFVIRSLLGYGGMVCFYTAAAGLSLADLSLIAKLQPVLVGLLAPALFGQVERVGKWVWVALAGGLIGSAILIGPELAIGSTFGLWAMAGSVLSAGAHLSVRALGKTEEPEAIVLWFQIALLLLAVSTTLVMEGRLPALPSAKMWPIVIVTGVCATLGQSFMTNAYRHDRAAMVAGAAYAGPIWGVLLDLLVFGHVPTPWVVLGGGLIITSGLVFLRRG
jgi:drug/metabolite transporter (DMT)-like permease